MSVLTDFKRNWLIWDYANRNFLDDVIASSGDANGRELWVQVVNGSKIVNTTGISLMFSWNNPKNQTQGLDNFELVDASKGIYKLTYKTGFLTNEGVSRASLRLVSPTEQIMSRPFNVTVLGVTSDDSATEATDSYTALTEALMMLTDWGGGETELSFTERVEIIVDGRLEELDITQGSDGLSAFQIWLNLGNTGTEADFIEALRGPKGDPGDGSSGGGLSAYETWLNLGNSGTEQDFIDSLKGEPGSGGVDPELIETLERRTEDIKAEEIKFKTNGPLRPMVSVIDDDGDKAVMTVLKPIADAKNFKFCASIITGFLGLSVFMPASDVVTLFNEGHEINSHTVSHEILTTLNPTQLDNELKNSKAFLEDLLNTEITDIVPPYGGVNTAVTKAIRKYYKHAYWGQGVNTTPLNSQHIRRITIGERTDLTYQWLLNNVNNAIANNQWLVFNLHIGTMTAEEIQWFEDLIDYIQSQNVDIVLPREALKVHGNALELWNDETGEHTAIGKDGRFHSSGASSGGGGDFQIGYTTGITASTLLTDSKFAQNKMNVSVIYSGEQAGFPRTAGVVHTFRPASGEDGGFGYQLFYPYDRDGFYKRQWRAVQNVWSSWREFQASTVFVEELNSVNNSTHIDSYRANAITHIPISTAHAISQGFPNGQAGLLITNKMFTWDYGYQSQVYKIFGSEREYTRSTNSSGAWRAWEPLNVGVLNQYNEQRLLFWSGSQVEYDAIGTKNANTLYFIEG